tara:strand:- start:9146 stop:10318 length:1173 start_codon:yes stop_codon:yes gene_type:complete
MADDKNKFFNALKLKGSLPFEKTGRNIHATNKWYFDGSDAYANKGFVIGFQYSPAGSSQQVYFKAFVTAFNETYMSDWSSEQVYGRADPIMLWKSTGRSITMAFKIPCASAGEGYENLTKLQTLIKFMYPVYTEVANSTTVAQSPVVRMRFMNLVQRVPSDGGASFAKYTFDSDANNGLLGVIKNISINHNLETSEGGAIEWDGISTEGLDFAGTAGQRGLSLLPRYIDVNLDFTPLHEHPLGWQKTGDKWKFGASDGSSDFGGKDAPFPYGAAADPKTSRDKKALKQLQDLDAKAIAAHEAAQAAEQNAPTQSRLNLKGSYAKLRSNMKVKSDARSERRAAQERANRLDPAHRKYDKEYAYETTKAKAEWEEYNVPDEFGLTADDYMDF